MKKKTDELYSKAQEYVSKKYTLWKTHWQDYHDKCKEMKKEYLAEQDIIKNNGKLAKVKPSLAFSIIETVLATTHEAQFEEPPYLLNEPVGVDDVKTSEIVTEFIAHQMDKNNLKTDSIPYERNRVMLGLSWAYVPWKLEYASKRRKEPEMEPVMEVPRDQTGAPLIDPETGQPFEPKPMTDPMTGQLQMRPVIGMDGKPVTKKVWKKEIVKDRWEFEPLENWDVFCDPAITNPLDVRDKGEGVIIKRFYSPEELMKLQKDGIYKGVDDYFVSIKEEGDEEVPVDESPDKEDAEFGKIPVLCFWGKFRVKTVIDKKGREILAYDKSADPVECVIDVPENGEGCFRCKRNPIDEQIRPIICGNLHPQIKSLVSPGFLAIIYSEYQCYKEFVNSRLVNLNMQMNPMWFGRTGALTGLRNLKYVPTKILRTPDPNNDLAPVPTPSLGQTYSQDVGMMQMEMQESTNAIKASQRSANMGQAFSRTAAGVNFFQDRIASRLGMVVDVGEVTLFGGLFDIVHSYNAQFLEDPQAFAVIGKENVYEMVTPESFTRRRDWKPVGASSKLKKAEMMAIIDRMLPELKQLRGEVKVSPIIMKYVKLSGLFKDPKEIMLSEEEKQKFQQQSKHIPPKTTLGISFKDLPPAAKLAIIETFSPDTAKSITPEEMLAHEERIND